MKSQDLAMVTYIKLKQLAIDFGKPQVRVSYELITHDQNNNTKIYIKRDSVCNKM
jgi:hypothetical protein